MAEQIGLETSGRDLEFLADVPQRLEAEVARAEISMTEIVRWEVGSVVRFDKVLGESVDLLAGDRLIARGEVVIVNDRYGLRVSEITHPDERVNGRRR